MTAPVCIGGCGAVVPYKGGRCADCDRVAASTQLAHAIVTPLGISVRTRCPSVRRPDKFRPRKRKK